MKRANCQLSTPTHPSSSSSGDVHGFKPESNEALVVTTTSTPTLSTHTFMLLLLLLLSAGVECVCVCVTQIGGKEGNKCAAVRI